MVVGLLTLELHFPGARSLKDKRHVLHGLQARIRKQYNVSVAEVEFQDLWQRSRLAVVAVNTDQVHLESTLQAVAAEAASARDGELVDQQLEVL
jgi:uncharacterized protein YlxP (DUF503 family)